MLPLPLIVKIASRLNPSYIGPRAVRAYIHGRSRRINFAASSSVCHRYHLAMASRLDILADAAEAMRPEPMKFLMSENHLSNLFVDHDSSSGRRHVSSSLLDEHRIVLAITTSWAAAADSLGQDSDWEAYAQYDQTQLALLKNRQTRMSSAWYVSSFLRYRKHPDPKSQEARSLLPTPWAEPR